MQWIRRISSSCNAGIITAMGNQDALSPEYPADLIKSGVRGKYAQRYREGTNVVLIKPDLHRLFPTTEAVNHALRKYAEEHDMALTG